jgi:hypothetical protein
MSVRTQNFGMDEHLAVARHGPVDPFARVIDGDDIVRCHFLETDARRFHQKAPGAIRQTQRYVSGDVVILSLAHQHAARLDKFFVQSMGHGCNALPSAPVVAVRRNLYIE